MPTTLAQKLYLLCYTVKKEKFQLDNIQGRGQLLRAGAMTELARRVCWTRPGGRFGGSPAIRLRIRSRHRSGTTCPRTSPRAG